VGYKHPTISRVDTSLFYIVSVVNLVQSLQ
jgi:hypothetical protein